MDISLANSLDKIQNIVSAKASAENDKVCSSRLDRTTPLTTFLQLKRKVALIENVSIDDLALDFTIPGYDIELRVSPSRLSYVDLN